MVMPPGAAGAYRLHFTGSKEHNVRLRARARDRGWSLSEYGFQRIGEDGEPLTGDEAELRTFADRGRGLRLPRPAVHRAGAARGRGRDRGSPDGDAAQPDHPGRPARRLPQPQRLERRHPFDRGHGRGRPASRLRLPGPDRPHPVARDRQRVSPPTGSRRSARSSPGSTPGSPPRRLPGARRPRRRPRASASSTAASSRSGPTASSTTRTTCWPGSTSSWPRSTSPAASRGPS